VPPPEQPAAGLTPKAAQTRAQILAAALGLFRESGYDGTTMRAVARAADVSLGNAYYYFASKEHLIQGFYDQIQVDHAEAAASALATETGFSARLRAVLETWVDVAAPYHEFAGAFFKNAAEPRSPLSPFSAESTAAREASIALYRRVVEGSDVKVSPALRAQLPELLWLLQMGVVLFWVHDDSPAQRRTRDLVANAVPLVDRLARLTRLPVARGLADDVVELVRKVRG
jgi:AcrR family transcriptional regulator